MTRRIGRAAKRLLSAALRRRGPSFGGDGLEVVAQQDRAAAVCRAHDAHIAFAVWLRAKDGRQVLREYTAHVAAVNRQRHAQIVALRAGVHAVAVAVPVRAEDPERVST